MAPPSPGFSAFAVDNYTNITLEAVGRFLEYAESGFPLLFVGPIPETSPYYGESDTVIQSGVQKLLTYPSVKHVAAETDVVGTLEDLGVLPTAQNLSPVPVLWTHRVDQTAGVDYFWVYNSDIYQSHATGASIKASGVPYSLDAWTGAITPIVNYTTRGDRTQIWVNLKSNASTIVAFAPEGFFPNTEVPSVHVTSTDFEDLIYSSSENAFVAQSTADTSHTVTLSDGRTVTYSSTGSLPSETILGPWQLVVQDWLPNPDPWYNYTSVYAYHNYTLDDLIPWYNISGLQNTSGIGQYTTQFPWQSRVAVGASLDLGFVFNTARLWINDHWTGPINVFDPVVDIGQYLVNGTNTVKIEVSSTLRNRLIQVNVTQSWEQAKYSSTYGPQPYGLTEPVVLKPYNRFKIPIDS